MSRRGHARAGTTSRMALLGYLFLAGLCVYLLLISIRSFRASALMQKRDRINVVLYGASPVLVSVGVTDGVHYVIPFSHEDSVTVSGGYGRYRVGALGKLAHLEKDPELISRTFASMISAYVDYSIAPKDTKIYSDVKDVQPEFDAYTVMKHVFSSTYTFDGNIFDKIYLVYTLAHYREQDFAVLKGTFKEDAQGEIIFSEKRFLKKYRGFFYHQSLRDEAEEVKLVYRSYSSAVTLSRIIEGQGVRVVDLSEDESIKSPESCVITSVQEAPSKTVHYLAHIFGCSTQVGKVEGADIQISLGSRLSEKWE